MFKAADRGMTQEVMICRVKMFCCWRSFKPTVSPVITMAIHTFVQWTFLFSNVRCTCCKRSGTQHSLLCSLCSVLVLQWPQKMASQCKLRLSFCNIDILVNKTVSDFYFRGVYASIFMRTYLNIFLFTGLIPV